MRLAILLVPCVIGGAAFVSAQGNPEFPQTQGQSSYGGSGTDDGNSWRSDQAQTGIAPAAGARENPAASPEPPRSGVQKRVKRAVKRGGGNDGPNEQAQSGDDRGDGGRDGEASSGGSERARPVDLAAARENFAAVVEGYVSKRSGKGYWSYAMKKGRARRLVDPSVDERSVRRVRGARYAARVSLRDTGGGKPVSLEFEADFSGTNWRVVAVRPAPVSSRR